MRVRWLIRLSSPIMVAVGFYTIFVASSLLEEGVSSDAIGLLLGVGGLAMVLTAIPLGLISDRRGRKGLLVSGAAAFPPVLLVFAATRDPLLMLLAAALSGVAEAAFFSSWNALIGLGAGFILPLITIWLFLRFGVLDAQSGPLLALANLTIGLAVVGSAGLARRRGAVPAIAPTQGLSTVFMLSLAFVPNPVLAGGLYIVRSALMNMASPIMDSYLMGIISPEDRGFASALNSAIWRLPNSVTTVIGGILRAAGNYNLPICLATAFHVVAIAGFYALFRYVGPSG